MCGIAGIVQFSKKPVVLADLQAMNQAMRHRGPDGDGLFVAGNVGLAHRRLAIIDPRAGVQPFKSEDDGLALTYNGEVYNYIELKDELKAELPFRTTSDTEVVLRAYQKWGIDSVSRLQGMFAFGLYDRAAAKLYLVRDRLGIKPLYYHCTPERLAFASELSALLTLPWLKRDIDPEGVRGFLQFQYVPTPRTIYRNVHKLEPGCWLEIDCHSGKMRSRRFWSLTIQERQQTEEQWLAELEAEFDLVAKRYIRSDVPCGSFLSGGIDSSLVTAMMARHTPTPPMSFCCGFEEETFSELPFARQVADIVGTQHHESIAHVESAVHLVRTLTRHFGEPFGDSSAVPTYLVSKAAAARVKVVLSGDGGDEMFGGYTSYATIYQGVFQATAWQRIRRIVNRFLAARGVIPKVRRWAADRVFDLKHLYRLHRRIFNDYTIQSLLKKDVAHSLAWENKDDLQPFLAQGHDAVTSCQAQDVHSYMLDDILTKVDRTSMANSLEVRVPFLDHKIVELAFSLPLHLRMRPVRAGANVTKYLLKKLAEKFFPASLIHRPKMGFGIPVDEWCRSELRELIEDDLRDPRAEIFTFLDFKAVQKTLDTFFHHGPVGSARIWCLLMLDLWFREVHSQKAIFGEQPLRRSA